MYKKVIRPLMFCFPAEKIHKLINGTLRVAGRIPGFNYLLRTFFAFSHPSLKREVLGLKFPNPVGIAAGFDKNGEIYPQLSAMGFGFVEIGTVTPRPQPGNPAPRLFRLKADRAIINRMGFNNRGLENMARNLRRRNPDTVIGVNLGKNTTTPNEEAPADYLKMFRSLYLYADYFVVNVSCPNVKDVTALQDRENLLAILTGLFEFRRGQNIYRPVLLKISPDLSPAKTDEIIDILIETPLDGLVAANTTTTREGLQTPAERISQIGAGGLSGAPLFEKALGMVRYLHEKTEGRYPIIGVGGISTPAQARAMLDAGASLVQLYTGFIYEGPATAGRICRHLAGQNR